MKSYRFITTISEKGTIQIPFTPSLFNKEVEIIIVPKPAKSKRKSKAKDFVEKWAGFLRDDNIDDAKYEYLSEKYK